MPYNQLTLSLGVGTGYRWSTPLGNLTLSGGFRIGFIWNLYDDEVYRPFDPVLRDSKNNTTLATSIWTSISLDQRDIFYDPSKGYYGTQRFGLYGIFDENEKFIRSDTKAEIFFTLFDFAITENWGFKAVLGFHTGLSFILPSTKNGPIIERANRLAVDGMFNGRGWSNEFGNKGNALWENWMEIRLPVVPGILSWDFFFVAAGVKATNNAGDFFTSFSSNDMRYSLGYGIRFTIPQFPLRFSFAHCFKFVDGNWVWMDNGAGRFVLSFAISTY
jgi:outer membrane protein insertion porin family